MLALVPTPFPFSVCLNVPELFLIFRLVPTWLLLCCHPFAPALPTPPLPPSRHFIVALLLSSLSGRQQCLLSLDGGKVHISRTDQELRPALSCIIGWKASLSSFCITRPSQTGCTGICLVFSRRWISNKISAKDFARHDPSTLLATHTVQSVETIFCSFCVYFRSQLFIGLSCFLATSFFFNFRI